MNEFPASNWLMGAIFFLAVSATGGGALIAVGSRRLVRSVTGLALCSVGLAGLFYFLNSPFLALMEILIYIGAVCVTIIFAIMLSEADELPRTETSRARWIWGGGALLASAAAFAGICGLSLSHDWVAPARAVSDGSVKAIGISLLSTYSMAFELISVVLVVAIIGALALARPGRIRS